MAALSRDIGAGRWAGRGLPAGRLCSQDQLDTVRMLLTTEYFPRLNLLQLFVPDSQATLAAYRDLQAGAGAGAGRVGGAGGRVLSLQQDPHYRRHGSTVDLQLAVLLYPTEPEFCAALASLVEERQQSLAATLARAVDNIVAGAAWQCLDPAGPRQQRVSHREGELLVAPYFTCPDLPSLEAEMELAWLEGGAACMAHNGWVAGQDPLLNFALPPSQVYLERELVAWGDSVKLRFGDRPADSPWLWQHMQSYVEQVAGLFDGVRLDNCHSTPLHVAAHMLDAARRARPELLVTAELFTGSQERDNQFVTRLGLTCLVREALSAWDSHELGRLIQRYGGREVGSLGPARQSPALAPALPHALFLDWTHDNPSPVEAGRGVADLLTSAALLSMAACPTGSNRGYDELVPKHIRNPPSHNLSLIAT